MDVLLEHTILLLLGLDGMLTIDSPFIFLLQSGKMVSASSTSELEVVWEKS